LNNGGTEGQERNFGSRKIIETKLNEKEVKNIKKKNVDSNKVKEVEKTQNGKWGNGRFRMWITYELVEITSKMQPCNTIYYSNVY
jgi:hypothetical protein